MKIKEAIFIIGLIYIYIEDIQGYINVEDWLPGLQILHVHLRLQFEQIFLISYFKKALKKITQFYADVILCINIFSKERQD
jgi:arginine decarboxylase-like protein